MGSVAELTESLSDPGMASYVICWMRLVASAELQRQPDFYINFLPDVVSVQDFCRRVYICTKITVLMLWFALFEWSNNNMKI